jgi:uncharacterized protein (UPF0335 family)
MGFPAAFETNNHGMNADESKPVAPEVLRNIVATIESIDDEMKAITDRRKEAMADAKAKGLKMKPFRLFLKNRRRDKGEVSEEQRTAEAYQDIMEGKRVII